MIWLVGFVVYLIGVSGGLYVHHRYIGVGRWEMDGVLVMYLLWPIMLPLVGLVFVLVCGY